MIQNAADRFLTGVRKREHITPILMSLNWLTVHYRVEFKILLFVFKSLKWSGSFLFVRACKCE